MKELSPLENQLLVTLSFLEPMSLEYIFIDLNKDFLLMNQSLTTKDLELSLKNLVALKIIKKISPKKSVKDGQEKWIRNFPKKSLWSRLQRFLKL